MGRWTCEDIGTAPYQGYASPLDKMRLEEACVQDFLPYTGAQLGILVGIALALLLLGLILRYAGQKS